MTTGFWLAYVALCCLQGGLVLVPDRAPGGARRAFAVAIPAALLVLGVLLVRDVSNGDRALTDLASVGTPIAAACCGWLLGRGCWIAPIAAAALFVVAWRASGVVADAAGTLLIAGACLSGAALLGRLAGRRELALGLVLLVILDVVLVFGTSDVERTTVTLHAVAPPSVAGTRPLPALQDVTLGDALMGWLDLLAPAVLGVVLAGSRRRPAAALAVAAAGVAWGTLLYTTSTIPATVPVLAGLAVAAPRILPFPWTWRSARSSSSTSRRRAGTRRPSTPT